MDIYVPNRSCYCGRCRARGFMGPAVLITLGVLLLLDQFNIAHFWHRTWPVVLIVIGVVKILGSSSDTSGHIPPFGMGAPGPVPPPAGTVPPAPPTQPPQGVNNV